VITHWSLIASVIVMVAVALVSEHRHERKHQPKKRGNNMTTEDAQARAYWSAQRMDAVNAVLTNAELAIEDVRGLLAEMASPSPDPRTIPA
jgi:hypothetical protein